MNDDYEFTSLGEATTIIVEPVGPSVLTGETNRTIKIDVVEACDQSFRMTCPDGTVLEIKPGKSKILVGRKDGRLHLLDCACPVCEDTRKRKPEGNDAQQV